jgi:hypothetical protein
VLIKSTILAQMSGSLNGSVFAHNRGGAYARNRSIPANPATTRQGEVRTSLTVLALQWGQVLTQSQRDAWANYAAANPVTNRLGDQTTLSGIAQYTKTNQFRVGTLGAASINDPPVPSAPPGGLIPSFLSATASNMVGGAGNAQMTINTSGPTTGYSLALYSSGGLSPGKGFWKGPYTDLRIIGGGVTPLFSSPADLTPDALQKIAARATLYITADKLPLWTVYIQPLIVEP